MEGHIFQEPPPPSAPAGAPPGPTSWAAARTARLGPGGGGARRARPEAPRRAGPAGAGLTPRRRLTAAAGCCSRGRSAAPTPAPPSLPHACCTGRALSSRSPGSRGTEPSRHRHPEPSCAGGRRRGPGRQTRGSGGARAGAARGRGAGWRRGRCARWPRPGPAPASLTRPGRGGQLGRHPRGGGGSGPAVGQPGRCQV